MNAAEAQKYYWKEIVRSREIAKDIDNDRESKRSARSNITRGKVQVSGTGKG